MLFTSHSKKALRVSNSPKRKSGALSAITFVTVLTLSVGTAWSYDYDVSRETLFENSKAPPSAAVALCAPLLNSAHNTLVTSTTARNQRTAGKVAALGLVLGVRFALEPQKDHTSQRPLNKASKIIENDKNRSALTIASYRKCLKDETLEQMAKN